MDPDDLQARVRADLSRLCDRQDVPGASVVVMHGAHIVEASAGVINTRTREAVTADTLFQIQSVTKIFTATLVMQLVEEGLVDPDRPVRSYLPEFRTADRDASARITARHLLTHTGGFEGDLWQPTTSDAHALDRFVRDLVSNAAQHSPPGRHFSYCNAGFGTLGRLVEVVRDCTYEQAVRRHIADPLGIDELAFSADQALAFRTAIGHVRPDANAPLRPTREWAVMPPSNPAAGNQLAMSARDLAKLGQAYVSGGRTPDGGHLLAPQTIAQLLEAQLPLRSATSATPFQGLGWRLPKGGVAEHTGGAPGIAAILTIVPEQHLVAVVLTNADAGARLVRNLLDPLLEDLAGVAPTPTTPTPAPESRVSDAQPYVGRYAMRQAQLDVTGDDAGRLWLTREPQHDELAVARAAGITPVTDRNEIRPIDSERFALVGKDGRSAGFLTFLDPGPDGRFGLLADLRAAARTD